MLKKIWFNFLRPFYIQNIIHSISKLILPFYIIYLLHIWLNLRQIALIWSFRSIIWLLFEIPTWTIADLYWKKFSVILWYILTWITLFLIPFFDWFLGISIMFCINALAETLFSWSDSAWVSNTIEEHDHKIMDSYFSWIRSIRNIWFILSWIIASFVAKHLWMDWLWYIFWIWTIFSWLILLFARDWKKWYEEESEDWLKKDFWLHIKKSFSYLWNNKLILFLFIWIALFYLTDEITWLIWTPYIQQLWFNIENLWYIYSIIWIWWVIIPFIAERILKIKKNPTSIIFWVCIWFSALLLFSGLTHSVILIISLFVIYNIIDDLILPIEETITNKSLEKKKRATLLSIKSMVESLSSIIWGPLAWLLLGYITLSQWLIVWAWLIILMGVIYNRVWFFHQKQKMD